MAQVNSEHSIAVQPTTTSAPRPPTPQEEASALLAQWQANRAAGIPADKRLEERS